MILALDAVISCIQQGPDSPYLLMEQGGLVPHPTDHTYGLVRVALSIPFCRCNANYPARIYVRSMFHNRFIHSLDFYQMRAWCNFLMEGSVPSLACSYPDIPAAIFAIGDCRWNDIPLLATIHYQKAGSVHYRW